MFACKQNVIELILCLVFDLKEKRQERRSHLFLVTPMDKSHEVTPSIQRRRGMEGEARWFQLVSYR